MMDKSMPATIQKIHDWWTPIPAECFWLEVTGRADIGVNLKAPQTNEHELEFWSYSLLKYVHEGDLIFHYDRNQQAIIARSTATGKFWNDSIVWAARGALAREAGIRPHTRPGWYVGLEDYQKLENPLELETIRAFQNELSVLMNQLIVEVGSPLYFPFEMGIRRPMRPMQGYLFKLPLFFVQLLGESLGEDAFGKHVISDKKIDEGFGVDYRIADEETSVGERDPFSIDPAIVERGIHGHAVTQNALAELLIDQQLIPLSPGPDEPNYDLAWKINDEIWIAEIKSITNSNEEKQLRLGLGQLLRYCQLLQPKGKVYGILAIERAPSDPTWIALCEAHNILLVWPDVFSEKIKR
jgi:hypothetical protein